MFPTCSVYTIYIRYVSSIHTVYSGFLSREKTFANCLKIDFHGENCREFAVTQCTTPTSAVSNCLKIEFHGENCREFAVTQCTTPTSAVSNCLKIEFHRENFRGSPQKCEIRESFLPRKKPAIRLVMLVVNNKICS